MDNQERLDSIIQTWFDKVRPAFVSELRLLIAKPFPAKTHLLWFEWQHDVILFPFMLFPMDRTAGQLDNIYFDVPGLTDTVPEFESLHTEGLDVYETIGKKIFLWLADCWQQAGGPAIAVPAYGCSHDDNESFDLKVRQWVYDNKLYED